MIKIKDLSIKYEDKVIFDNFNLEINKGDFVTLTGPSGSGKTTLLYAIGNILNEYQGTIEIDNKEINKKHVLDPNVTSKVGFIFQNFLLVENETVLENLALINDDKKEIEKALSYVGLSGCEDQYIYQLSGGEQQRIAIARVLIRNVDIILGDEITGNLDEENSRIILELIKKLNEEGKTIVLVTHDSDVVTYAKREIKINK